MTINDREAKRPRRDLCARCGGSAWRPIAYGFPGQDMMEAAEHGEIELGGCILEEDAPVRRCRRCGLLPGRPMEWSGIDGPRTGEFADQHRVLVPSQVPTADAEEPELLAFALSFDGYEALGVDGVATLSREVRSSFEKRGYLPDNLVVLRSCLFFEQRVARASDATLRTPYVFALLAAIQAESSEIEQIS